MYHLDWIKPNWPAPENVACVTTTRLGGCSQALYKGLNLGNHVGDDEKRVEKNRQILIDNLQLPSEPIWLDQQHGNSITQLQSDNPSSDNPSNAQADAAFTNKIGVTCAVLTADCLPVLFSDNQGQTVAVAHAGWRGLVAGVLENTLKAMPASNVNIMCWLGPAIGPNKFEVGKEVYKKFVEKDKAHKNAFQEKEGGKYLANIYQLAKNILVTKNIKDIYGGEYCTYSQEDKFYSYRRDGQTGRMATLIWKKARLNHL